jgi:hypothetical protein
MLLQAALAATIMHRYHAPEKPEYFDAILASGRAESLIAVVWKCMGAASAYVNGKGLRELLDILLLRKPRRMISYSCRPGCLGAGHLFDILQRTEWWSGPVALPLSLSYICVLC